MVTAVFVGSITPIELQKDNKAFSPAGELVQREIMAGIASSARFKRLVVASMTPCVAKLMGREIFVRSWVCGDLFGLSFINLPIIKHLTFGFGLYNFLRRNRPHVIFVYNANFFWTIALILYRKLCNSPVILCGILQDVLPISKDFRTLQRRLDFFALKIWRRFDWVVPISEKIVQDFKFSNVLEVLKGGVTAETLQNWSAVGTVEIEKSAPYFVFAGALEPYNGIDLLVQEWLSQAIPHKLKIFGAGSLETSLQNLVAIGGNVEFCGRVPNKEVLSACAHSSGVFCLRYSRGINADYFFPSKLFELLVSPVSVFVNFFPGLDANMLRGCHLLSDDLSNLRESLECIESNSEAVRIQQRRTEAVLLFSYRSRVVDIVNKVLNSNSNKFGN